MVKLSSLCDFTEKQISATKAADVHRYLDDEPVQACPPSILYRVRKLARRYRAPLATAGLLVFMLMAATAVSVRYAYVADAARKESDKERVKTNNEKINTEKALIVAAEQSRVADERRVRAEQLEARYGLEFTRFVKEFTLMNPHDEERLLL